MYSKARLNKPGVQPPPPGPDLLAKLARLTAPRDHGGGSKVSKVRGVRRRPKAEGAVRVAGGVRRVRKARRTATKGSSSSSEGEDDEEKEATHIIASVCRLAPLAPPRTLSSWLFQLKLSGCNDYITTTSNIGWRL